MLNRLPPDVHILTLDKFKVTLPHCKVHPDLIGALCPHVAVKRLCHAYRRASQAIYATLCGGTASGSRVPGDHKVETTYELVNCGFSSLSDADVGGLYSADHGSAANRISDNEKSQSAKLAQLIFEQLPIRVEMNVSRRNVRSVRMKWAGVRRSYGVDVGSASLLS